MAFGKGLAGQKQLSVLQLCEMEDGVIYVNTNKEIDSVYRGVAVLRTTECGSFACKTEWNFYV
jgi:hypothetical protein